MKHFLKQTVRTYNDGRVEVILPFKSIHEKDSEGRIIHSKDTAQESWYSYDPVSGKVAFERNVSYSGDKVYSTREVTYKYDEHGRMTMEKTTSQGTTHTYTMTYNEYGQTSRHYDGVIVESTEYKEDGSVKRFCTYDEGLLSTIDEYYEDGNMYSCSMNVNGSWKEECWYNNETSDFERRLETSVSEGETIIWDYEYITDDGHNYAYKVTETRNGELVSRGYYKGHFMIELQTPEYTETYEYINGP